MHISRPFILQQLRHLLVFLIASVVQSFFMCARCNSVSGYVKVVSFTFFMWVFLYKGNEGLTNYISCKVSWIEFPVKRMIIGVLVTVSYTVLIIIGLVTAFQKFAGFNFGNSYYPTIYSSIILTIVISLVLHSRAFLLHWKEAALEAEKFQRESITARYESLKNQVNPHFLFNSLNALTGLIYEDPDRAAKFVKQLSEVYRYVLDTRDKEVVDLDQELKFLNSYLFLQSIRFGHNLVVDLHLNGSQTKIAPLALQMLIENAIKHNVISEQNPLRISLYEEDEHIVVENNVQQRDVIAEPSSGVGLDNITKRYTFLSSKPVQIVKDEHRFIVKLPMLHN